MQVKVVKILVLVVEIKRCNLCVRWFVNKKETKTFCHIKVHGNPIIHTKTKCQVVPSKQRKVDKRLCHKCVSRHDNLRKRYKSIEFTLRNKKLLTANDVRFHHDLLHRGQVLRTQHGRTFYGGTDKGHQTWIDLMVKERLSMKFHDKVYINRCMSAIPPRVLGKSRRICREMNPCVPKG